MEKEFVPYELAVKLKALGFDEPCLACYTENAIGRGDKLQFFVIPIACNDDYVFVAAPLYQQAFRWFREKYGHLSYIDMDNYSFYRYTIYKGKGISEATFETYEEAELACLTKLIEIVETQTN